MDATTTYACLADPTRVRILRLLAHGPLCVCHIHDALAEPQVKISKHLAYLKERDLVIGERRAHWMIYRLPDTRPPLLAANLDALRDPAAGGKTFRDDDARLKKIRATFTDGTPDCVRERA